MHYDEIKITDTSFDSPRPKTWNTSPTFESARARAKAEYEHSESDTLVEQLALRDHRRSNRTPKTLLYLATVILLIAVFLQLYIIFNWRLYRNECTSFGRIDKIRKMEFVDVPDFQNTKHDYDILWEELIPPSGGIVALDDNPIASNDNTYGVSMFHQLHCLMAFRHAIQLLQDGKKIGYSPEDDTSDHKGHWPHCFDYMRQTILCHADDTREPYLDNHGGISGMGVERTCRDKNALYAAARNSKFRGVPKKNATILDANV